MGSKPLIEEARIRFSGLSTESFDLAEVGDSMVLTIRGRVKKVIEEEQASEGTRHVMNLSIEKVLTGVNSKITEGASEPTLFDQPVPEDETSDPEDEPDLDDPDDERGPESEAVSEPTPINIKRPDPEFEGGPQFSA